MEINLKNKRVAILGWGVDNADVAPYLTKHGANLTIFDEAENLNIPKEIKAIAKVYLGKRQLQKLVNYDYIFRTPGIYRFRPEILAAERSGVQITSKIRFFFDICPGKIIGVTGTKGKGTTSTLVYEMLKRKQDTA